MGKMKEIWIAIINQAKRDFENETGIYKGDE